VVRGDEGANAEQAAIATERRTKVNLDILECIVCIEVVAAADDAVVVG